MNWAGNKALQEKALAARPDNLSLVLRTHMMKGKNKLQQVVL